MYTIYVDGNALYSPLLINEGYCVLNPKITKELNKAGSLTFLLPPNNVMYDSIKKLKSIITVYEDGVEIFRGRVLHDEKDFYNRKNVYCEGELAFLLDSPVRPYTFKGDIPDLFKKFINTHNASVEDDKKFEVGEVTVTDPNNYINRSNSDYSNTWQELNDKLIKTHSGYIRTRLSNGTRYVDYIEDYNHISSQVIQFGENLLDISQHITAENVFTCLIPIGADGLTIKSVNNNLDYIQDDSAVALFGKIWKTKKWDDVTVASNLLNKGRAYLNSGIEMAVSLNISAVDLHLINVDAESIKLGDKIRVVSLPHNIDKYFLCSKIVIDLVSPDKTSYTLGVKFSSMTDKQTSVQETVSMASSAATSAQASASQASQSASEASEAVNQIITELPSEYVKKETFNDYQTTVDGQIEEIKTHVATVNEVHNYSTAEHVVGTWIDNKPLYEKTILINDLSESTITSMPGGGYIYTKLISQLVPDMHKFISLEAFNETYGHYYPYIFQDESNKNYSVSVIVDLSLGGFYISFSKSINISLYYGSNIYITIKYTKTNDSPITPQVTLENAINNTKFSSLETKSKYLVGAINEVNGNTINQDGVILKKVGNIIFVYLTSNVSLKSDGKTITTITDSEFIPQGENISTLTYCYNGSYISCRILFDYNGNITVTDFWNNTIPNLQVGFLQTKSFFFIK